MRIGRLSAKLTPGVFVIEDLLIEGLTPTDRPFLKAKKIEVRVPWWTAFSRKLIVESVTMTDWDMVVESWPGGRHSFPKVTPKNPRKGPSTFTTTLRYVLATRGQFTYDDHGDAVEHRRPQPDAAAPSQRADQRLPRPRHDHERHGADSGVPAVPHGHAVALQPQRRQGALRPHGPRERRRADGRDRRRRSRALAGTALPAEVTHRLSDPEGDLLSRAEVRRVGRRGFHRDLSSLQGRARAEGGVCQRPRGRQRLAVPQPARIGAVASRSPRDHQRHERALRRDGAVRLPHGAVWPADTGAGDVGRGIQRRRSRAAVGLSRDRRAAHGGAGVGPEPARVAARQVGAQDRSGRSDRRGAAGRAAHDARVARRPRRRARRAPRRGRAVQPALCRSATCRSRARSSTRSTRSGFGCRRAGWRRAGPTSSSKVRPRLASSRASRST